MEDIFFVVEGAVFSTRAVLGFGMEKPTLEEVVLAIDALYRSQDKQEKEKASIWLTYLISTVRLCT